MTDNSNQPTTFDWDKLGERLNHLLDRYDRDEPPAAEPPAAAEPEAKELITPAATDQAAITPNPEPTPAPTAPRGGPPWRRRTV